jgi:hypothetical protein
VKVKITESVCAQDWAYRRGQILDIEPAKAQSLITMGWAVPHADPKPEIERATAPRKIKERR